MINHYAGIENKVVDSLSRLTVTLHRMSAHVIGFGRLKDEYFACFDFDIIYDEVSHGNHHEYVDFLVKNGYLFKVTKLRIPWTFFRDLLIWEMHAGGLVGHFGKDKIIALAEDRFYLPSLKKDVARITAQCRTCQFSKAKKQNTVYIPLNLFLMNLVDFVLGLPRTAREHDYTLVVIDMFSKMTHFISCNKTNDAHMLLNYFLEKLNCIVCFPPLYLIGM